LPSLPRHDRSHPPVQTPAEQAGCSRREAELLIEGGWVQVNGQVIEEPQHRVRPGQDQVSLDPQARPEPIAPATLLWHRPDPDTPCTVQALQQRPPSGAQPPRLLKRHFAQQECWPG
jgi:23S rRNA pseudouridine2604 synthase